jgi:hypothetical protein
MTVTTNERNQQNLWAKEPTMYMDPNYTVSHNERAEQLNGRLAMLGFVAAVGSYVLNWSNYSWSILMACGKKGHKGGGGKKK